MLDTSIWQVLSKFIGRIRIIIWLHGSEVQHWQRRPFELGRLSKDKIEKALADGAARDKMWRQVFRYKDKIEFVFSSEYLKSQTIEDYRLADDFPAHVIPNYVDQELFPYKEKRAEDRLKILSIRPYVSLAYANDLSAVAIALLRDKPWFKDLEFSFYGDGELFENTVRPLRKYPNVKIHKGFLLGDEISALYGSHGVFLSPTRMDTQGISCDEAMSSGLVPVTTNTSAVPEFADESSAMLTEPESALDLAEAIESLYHNPDLYLQKSKYAAEKARQQSGWDKTIDKEMRLIKTVKSPYLAEALKDAKAIVYYNANPNIIDGSSFWMSNVSSILGQQYKTIVLISRNLQPGNVFENCSGDLIFIEPRYFGLSWINNPELAADLLDKIAEMAPEAAILTRDYDAARILAKRGKLGKRLNAYLAGFYAPEDEVYFELKEKKQPLVLDLLAGSSRSHIQTSMLAEIYKGFFGHPFNSSLLPPSYDSEKAPGRKKFIDGSLHIGYGGKIYPHWGVDALLEVAAQAQEMGLKLHVHLAVSKIFADEAFKEKIGSLMERIPVTVHYRISREETMDLMSGMDFVWCWRDPDFEESIPEYSTKLIENAAMGLPCIAYPSAAQKELLGKDYPYFCRDPEEILALLERYKDRGGPDCVPAGMERFSYQNMRINLG